MKSILSIYDFLPVVLLVVQTLIILGCTVGALRYFKILQLPYAGMEYRKVVLATAALIAMALISFSDVEALIQTVKTYHQYDDGFYRNLLMKFSQFFLIIVIAELLLALVSFVIIRIIPGLKQSYSTEDDMPGAILHGFIIIIFAVLLYLCTKEIISTITPRYINFD